MNMFSTLIRRWPHGVGGVALAAFLCFPVPVLAASWTVTASVAFDIPLTIIKQSDINFGVVVADTADTYTVGTDGSVTAAGNGEVLGGASSAANLLISGSATQTVNISVDSLTSDNGVTIKNPTCSYAGGVAGSCSISAGTPPGSGEILLVGVDAIVKSNSSAPETSASPSFVVNVVYN